MTAVQPIEAARTNGKAGRVPPHSLDAERSLLGAVLNRGGALDEIAGTVGPQDFYRPAHGHIFDAMAGLTAAGEPVDTVTVAAQLAGEGLLEMCGGMAALAELQTEAPSTDAARYARIVAGHARLRRLISVAGEIAELGYSAPDPAAAVDRAEALLYAVASETTAAGRVETIDDAVYRAMDTLSAAYESGGRQGVPTGFDDLDNLLLGLHPEQLVTVAARPGMGKTAWGCQIGVHAAAGGWPVLFVSVEMSIDELINRVLSSESKVDLQRIRSAKMVERDWPLLSAAVGRLAGVPMFFLDAASDTVATVRAEIRRLAARTPPALVVVDYLQLLQPENSNHRDNRQVDVSEIAKGLKRISREFAVPVVALAQLSRNCELRADKRPVLADLRESGDIENTSDVVICMYRDDYYNSDSPDANVAELIVRKQRSGPQGTARVAFFKQWTRFANMARM